MSEAAHGLTRRQMMTGLSVGAGLAIAAPALTAAAAPITNHIPAWGADFFQALGPTNANLHYAGVDGMAFWPTSSPLDRYIDAGNVGHNTGQALLAPLDLPPGSVIRQVNLACRANEGQALTLNLLEKVFEVDSFTGPATVGPLASLIGAAGTITTVTNNLATPITLAHGRTYLLSINLPVGNAIRGVTIGYTPPAAAFVPFAGPTPRVYDSRTGDGKLGFQQERTIDLGNPGVRGALFNLTVTGTENSGFVAAFAGNVAYPGNSSINYFGGEQNLANGVVSAVAPDGTIKIRGGGPAGRAHVIIDRLGWFI